MDSFRSDTAIVTNRMRDELQKRTIVAGVCIEAFNINDLAYAPEIAAAMLKRQKAQDLIDARKFVYIVEVNVCPCRDGYVRSKKWKEERQNS